MKDTFKRTYSPFVASARGFTLLELMVTMAVATIIVTFGVPSFFNIIRDNRAATNANEFVTALTVARSESIKRGTAVTVCASADGASCGSNSDWSKGWIVFVDGAATPTGNPVIANSTDVLRAWPAPSGNATVTAATPWLRFSPRGEVHAATGVTIPLTFVMKLPACTGMQGRSIQVNAVGRAATTKAACP